MTIYRPWGELHWALELASARQWSFLGCLGPEDRSVASLIALSTLRLIANEEALLLQINDAVPEDSKAEELFCRANYARCQSAGIKPHRSTHGILDPRSEWLACFDTVKSGNVIMDISSMPKRFFFPLLKRIYLDTAVHNLFICYTSPKSYAPGHLNGNPEDWDVIPTFGTDDPEIQKEANKRLVVNIGFMPEGLTDHLDPVSTSHLIVPFPAPSRTVRRSWEAVRRLVGDPNQTVNHKVHRVGPQDMPEAFEKLLSLSANGQVPIALAPFGPKPISAAMCLYAAQSGMPVYYSQPKTYSVSYSAGVGTIFGYWVKIDGRSFYGLPD
jgi:hypothetical protein